MSYFRSEQIVSLCRQLLRSFFLIQWVFSWSGFYRDPRFSILDHSLVCSFILMPVKEHVILCIIAGSAGGQPYGVDNVVVQKAAPFMNMERVTVWNSLAWVAVTQLVGYGVAGITRRFLIKPSAMYWPSVLPTVALFTTLNGAKTLGDQPTKVYYVLMQVYDVKI
jgi:hypothetical protein